MAIEGRPEKVGVRSDTSLGAQLRTSLGAALLLALCQVVIETVIIAARAPSTS
jgi:hypothetical protein